MHQYANPNRFLTLSDRILPWLSGLAVVLFAIGLPWALVVAPPDYQQGETVRIMYVHVPAAWLAVFCYAGLAALSAASLIWRHVLADFAARAIAPIGACFTFLALASGALWGKPMWGTWWVWDARLTSVLILFFFYLGHIALSRAFEDPTRGARAAAILALVGVVNLPIVKWSVDWWSSLHQPASISRFGTPAIHPDILIPLLIMAAAYFALFAALALIRTRTEIWRQRLRVLRLTRIERQQPLAGPSRPAGA